MIDEEYTAVVNSKYLGLEGADLEEAMNKEKRNASQAKYNKAKTTLVTFRLNHATDADLLAYLQTVSNKQGLIKGLLRQKMQLDNFIYETGDNNGQSD